MNRETVGSIGEFGLIDRIRRELPANVRAHSSLTIGIGDDAAVWQPAPGEQILITTDALVDGIHFDLTWQPWESLGWKALAVNVSDIAAMGGRPVLATFTLGLQADIAVDDILAFYRGASRLAGACGMLIAGGDIVRSPNCLSIGVTVVGETRDGRVLSRSGAQPGDLIAVTGTLGAAAAGLQILSLPKADPRRTASTSSALIDALLEPQPRVRLGEVLLTSGASSAMDLSDGLLGDLPKLLTASSVSGVVALPNLPVAASVRGLFPEEWLNLAMRGGEDYELVFTASSEALVAIRASASQFGQEVTIIGEITNGRQNLPPLKLVDASGDMVELGNGAFDHFRN